MLLSSGTDTLVNLWRCSANSNSANENNDDTSKERLVKSFDLHEDSVYEAAWSASEGWIFGSVSYDGLFAVHHVPEEEKYSILLH